MIEVKIIDVPNGYKVVAVGVLSSTFTEFTTLPEALDEAQKIFARERIYRERRNRDH